ncbi:MAG: phosphotransferase family protein [Alphaproteobacteria bacterium]
MNPRRPPRPGQSAAGETPSDIVAALVRLGLAGPKDAPRFQRLAGGVSSDIWRVDLARGTVCVKRALPKLRVAADWRVPVERNLYEARWIERAGRIAPDAVPRLKGQDREAGALVMDFLPPERYPAWKDQLRTGVADADTATRVAARLAKIHAATAGDPAVAAAFPTDRIFHDIRLEPYLLATARAHTDRSDELVRLARTTAETKLCLVHGDVSPKNILVGPSGPVFIDAECAWYGDPAFDLAFCLNHLLLKCLWVRTATAAFLDCYEVLAGTYLSAVGWEPTEVLERRTARLLPGLLLARVDGKSPVEYLVSPHDKDLARRWARALLRNPRETLNELRMGWAEELHVER